MIRRGYLGSATPISPCTKGVNVKMKIDIKKFKKGKIMNKKIGNRNNSKMYAIQCSKCKKKMFPQTKKEKREIEELIVVEDLIKKWVSGKMGILPHLPKAIREYIEEYIRSSIQDRVYDMLLGDAHTICNCEDCSYGTIKCKAQGR